MVLFTLRYFNIRKKITCNKCTNCCPDCSSPLNRVKRTHKDILTNNLTLMVFDFKRYICTECGFEGLRWEDNYKTKNN